MSDEEEEPSKGPSIDPEAWMLSFGDLVSLMLVFFVMLFSMSTLEVEEFEAVVSALSQQFNPTAEAIRPKPTVDFDIPKIDATRAYSLDYLRALIGDKLAEDPVLGASAIHRLDDRLVISLPSDNLFLPGNAQLNRDALGSLALFSDLLRFLSNQVNVNGHTDPDPIATAAFPSNWELSLSRAIAVRRILAL